MIRYYEERVILRAFRIQAIVVPVALLDPTGAWAAHLVIGKHLSERRRPELYEARNRLHRVRFGILDQVELSFRLT